MSIEVQQHKGRWRLVDTATGSLARAANGSLLDKGGYATRQEAEAVVAREAGPPRFGFGMGSGFRGGKP